MERQYLGVHPYWGFRTKSGVCMLDRVDAQRIHRMNAPASESQSAEWLNVTSNNHGFFSPHDYPYHPKNSDEFLLGVFGGSIAQWFCLQQGASLAQDLGKTLSGKRKVVILNFGLGAFKQPQTMSTLTHFLVLGQHLDAVLLVDGFNEASLAWINVSRGISCALPNVSYIDMFRDVPGWNESEKLQDLPIGERVTQIASVWEEGAQLMREICRSRAIPFLHVLQPNQYFSRKRFSREELEVAISSTTPYQEGVKLVFPEFVERLRKMRRAGWNAFDATDIFDGRVETTYSDNCCHYNRLGNMILQEFILACMMSNGFSSELKIAGSSAPRTRGFLGWIADQRAKRAVSTTTKDSPDRKDDLYPMW